MPRQLIVTSISTITDTKSFDTSEDTYFAYHNGQQLTLMVADGAPQRLKTTGSMKALFQQYENVSKPGQYASTIARVTTAEQSVLNPQMPLRTIPLLANQYLRTALESVYGEISSKAVLRKEPTLTRLHDDPRLVRLILPASCITIARLDLQKGTLNYAHAGDTALFLLYQDGSTIQITPDQMKQHDDVVRQKRQLVVQEQQPKDDQEYRTLTAHAQEVNVDNGIYHNYEDKDGNTDLELGVGVINGLPQLETYLVSDTVSLDGVDGIVLTTDGMFWPGSVNDTDLEATERVNYMGDLIRKNGLKGYIRLLQHDRFNPESKNYQRFGKVDDATAIYVKVKKE